MNPSPRYARVGHTLLPWLALLPACFTGILTLRCAVDLPYADELSLVALFEKAAHGALTFHDLFAQQNEYRQFFPNLLIVTLGRLTRWDVRYEMLVSFLLACLVSFNLYHLGRLTVGDSRGPRLSLYLGANLLIFSTMQGENWLQGQQLIYFIAVACVTTCLLLAQCARLGTGSKFLLCGALAVVSSFSSANGLLCWLVALPPLALPAWRQERARGRLWGVGWLAGLALCAAVYFYDYRKPAPHPALTEALSHPARAVVYLLASLGRPLAFGLVSASCVGAALLCLFAWSGWQFARAGARAPHRARPMLGWLMLGAYSLLTAALLTVGRLGYGVEQALAPRYTTFTLYLPVALIHLLPLALGARAAPGRAAARGRVVPLLVAALIAVHLPIYVLGIRHMGVLRNTLLQLKGCVLLVNIAPDPCLTRLAPDVDSLRRDFNALDRLGYLRPGLLRSAQTREFAAPDARAPEVYGSFSALDRTADGGYTAAGSAVLPDRGDAADVVLLAYEQPAGEATVFAVAETAAGRDFVSALLGRGQYGDARWRRTFPAAALPRGPLALSAWAFDARTGRAYRLAGTQRIDWPPAPGRPPRTP
ncbi:MAG TPA: hypothetical protein VF546_09790 [Pyrinomonadaceae bacterium]|jgi:hypothetical protein